MGEAASRLLKQHNITRLWLCPHIYTPWKDERRPPALRSVEHRRAALPVP